MSEGLDEPRLRVALDGRELRSNGGGTGVSRYVAQLLNVLKQDRDVQLRVHTRVGPPLLGPQAVMPVRMRIDRSQVIHGPANVLPLFRYGIPGVVTIHDLAIYDHPEWFPENQWLALHVHVPRSVRKARIVICPSQATRIALGRIFQVPEERCRVIPHGVEQVFFEPAPSEQREAVRSRFGLPERYVLQVGTVQPRKNYETTLRALASIPEARRIPLVVAGDFGWKFEPVVEAVKNLNLARWVRFLGYVGMADLPALYQMATLVAFPSLDEGFGFPVLEAFASGVPIVAARAGAIPEVADDAALLFEAADDAEMARLLQSGADDEGLRERLTVAGRKRALEYTWSRAGAGHVAAYREAAA